MSEVIEGYLELGWQSGSIARLKVYSVKLGTLPAAEESKSIIPCPLEHSSTVLAVNAEDAVAIFRRHLENEFPGVKVAAVLSVKPVSLLYRN